jgi:hypothetical protein
MPDTHKGIHINELDHAASSKESLRLRKRSVRRVTEPGGSRPQPTMYPAPGRLGQLGPARRLTVPGPADTAPGPATSLVHSSDPGPVTVT